MAESNHRQRVLDPVDAARALADSYFNLIRRGADGSLKLSTDHWRLDQFEAGHFHFAARETDAPPLELELADVAEVVWDQLPKQQTRSQIRFRLTNGDLWTFSGTVDPSTLPAG